MKTFGVLAPNPMESELNVFYTVAQAFGLPSSFEYVRLTYKNTQVALLPDVHRGHQLQTAVWFIDVTLGIDPVSILELLHALREGVKRIVVVIASGQENTSPPETVNRLKQEAADVLAKMGVHSSNSSMHDAILLREAEEYVDSVIENESKKQINALFDVLLQDTTLQANDLHLALWSSEGKMLDMIAPLVRPTTYIETAFISEKELSDTVEQGSYLRAIPYLEIGETWPDCAVCAEPMACSLQVDLRDFKHVSKSGMYVVYECKKYHTDSTALVRYYDAPSAMKKLVLGLSGIRPAKIVIERTGYVLPEYLTLVALYPQIIENLKSLSSNPEYLYNEIAYAMGMCSLGISEHLGGWHHAWNSGRHIEAECSICAKTLDLVIQVEGIVDNDYGLWACPLHPTQTMFTSFK